MIAGTIGIGDHINSGTGSGLLVLALLGLAIGLWWLRDISEARQRMIAVGKDVLAGAGIYLLAAVTVVVVLDLVGTNLSVA